MRPAIFCLLLLELHSGLFSLSAAVSLAPAQTPFSGTAPTQKSWIVEGNATGKLAPTCSDLCIAVLNDEENFPAVLQPCEGGPPPELWSYDAETQAMVSNLGSSSNALLCLDASNPEELHLSACSGSANQVWIWDNQTMRLKSGSASGVNMYMEGEYRKPSDWGSGKNSYSLKLGRENTENAFVFTILPFYDPILIRPPAASGDSENLVRNGGFERCGFDPAKGFWTLDTTQPILLCSWFILSNEVEYSGPNLWQPEEGNHSLHLNSARSAMPGVVAQVLATKTNSNYSLHFFMSGNPDLACGVQNKTMEIRISPSSFHPQLVWFDISNRGETGWRNVGPVGFTAFADYVNLSFASLTPGSCGPLIDNVSVVEIHAPLPLLNTFYPSSTFSSSSSIPPYGIALISLAAAGFVLAGILFLFLQRRKNQKRLKSFPWNPKSSRSLSAERGRFWDSLTLSRLEGENSNAKELSWREIEKATRNFTTIIGEGGFSTVYKAQFPGGTLGAVKMEKTRDRSRQAFRQELSVLVRVRHANLVNLLGFCNERAEGILVFEYMAHGNLHNRLHPPAHQMYLPLPWKNRMAIALQIATALEYLHEVARPPIVHTDVKSANVLLDEEDNAKVCDFGFSAKAGPESSVFHSTVASVKGSLGYLDPQYLKNGRLSSKSDVYSFGVLLMELVTGLHAFDIHRAEALTSFAGPYMKDMEMVEMIVDGRLEGLFDRQELKVVCEIAELCVREEGEERPAMVEVVQKLTAIKVAQREVYEEDDTNLLTSRKAAQVGVCEEDDAALLAPMKTAHSGVCEENDAYLLTAIKGAQTRLCEEDDGNLLTAIKAAQSAHSGVCEEDDGNLLTAIKAAQTRLCEEDDGNRHDSL